MCHKNSKNPEFLLFSLVLLMITSANGLNNFGERCTISKGSGFTVDSCDGSKLLSCQYGRCACNDPTNQIYTYKLDREKRYKRGIGKNVAIGAGGAFIGYQVAKATSPGGPLGPQQQQQQSSNGWGNSQQQSSNGWGSNFHRKKIYSCYGLVGASCSLNYNNVKRVTAITVTNGTYYEVNNKNETTNETITTVNSTTTTTTTAAPIIFDINKLPKCVYRSVCSPYNSSDTSMRTLKSDDPRVGVCTCDRASRRTMADLCESNAYCSRPSVFIIFILISQSHYL